MLLKVDNYISEYPDGRFHNLPLDTERTVLIPLIWNEVIKYNPIDVLEVGNVLRCYIDCSHDVIDQYENGVGVINKDIRTYKSDKKYKLIVSITTLEHVGDGNCSDLDELGIIHAINNMKELLVAGGKILFSVPIAQNEYMDTLFRKGRVGYTNLWAMKKVNIANQWRVCNLDDVISSTILYYPFTGSNAEILCEIIKE